MNTGGGFFYAPDADANGAAGGSGGASSSSSVSRAPAAAPRRLTPLQSSRLMAWLDSALLALSRNHRRRHAPDSPLRSLRAYCAAVLPVLAVLASVPPAPPAGSLKVGYLLQLSDVVPEALAGYDAHGGRPTGRASEDVQETQQEDTPREEELEDVGTSLARALQLMHLIDAQWHALVRGLELDYAAAQAEATQLFPFAGPSSASVAPAPSLNGRHAAARPQEARQSDGASGRALSQTDRVRLRNVALRARATLRAWGRAALDVEPLPEEDEFAKNEARRAEGDLEEKPEDLDGIIELDDEEEESEASVTVKEEQEEEEEEMEEVLVPPARAAHSPSPPPREEQGRDETEEGRHFASVFSKTLDPDASDDEDKEDVDVKPVVSHDYSAPAHTSAPLKRPRSPSRSPPPRTRAAPGASRPRRSASQEGRGSTSPAPSPPAQLSEGVLAWDKSFARVLERTLAALADVQQVRLEREERAAAEGR